jgi:hypothetical protein
MNRDTETIEVNRDPEVVAMEAVFKYMDPANDRQRLGFMYHLVYRYFPAGYFNATELAPKTRTPTGVPDLKIAPPAPPMPG